MIGLYTIRNTKTGMFYIGSSVDIMRRISEHKATMKTGHRNWKFRRDYKRYGLGNFQFDVMLQCPESELKALEQEWLDMWVGDEMCYNISKVVEGPWNTGLRGAQVAWNKGLPKEQQPRYGKPASTQQKIKASKSNKGKNKGKIPWIKGKKLGPWPKEMNERRSIAMKKYRASHE